MCTPVFIAALYTKARTWKQPKSSWTHEQIKKLWYIYAMEYYLAIKRNTFESAVMRRINLEPFMQNKVKSEREKQVSYINTYTWNPEKWYR